MSHSLIEIPSHDWTELRDLYSENRKEPSGYGLLQTFIKWIEKDPNYDLKIYALDNDWKQDDDGTFVAIQNEGQSIKVYFNTLNNSSDRLTTILNSLNLKTQYLLSGFPTRNRTAVQKHFEYLGIDSKNFKPDEAAWYFLDKEKALQFQVDPPAEYTFSELQEKHAEQVNAIWPHQAPNSIIFVKCLIKFNDSVGLFDKTENLIGWCLRLPQGSLGVLQVVDNHKRKGLGNLILRYMSRLIASKNEEVMAPVTVTNVASRAMFEKLGFTTKDSAFWAVKL